VSAGILAPTKPREKHQDSCAPAGLPVAKLHISITRFRPAIAWDEGNARAMEQPRIVGLQQVPAPVLYGDRETLH